MVNTEAGRESMLRSTGLGIEFTLPNWVDEVIVSIKKLSDCMQVVINDSISVDQTNYPTKEGSNGRNQSCK